MSDFPMLEHMRTAIAEFEYRMMRKPPVVKMTIATWVLLEREIKLFARYAGGSILEERNRGQAWPIIGSVFGIPIEIVGMAPL